MSRYRLSHLDQLEAESVHIIREVVAEFDNPVMLYSVGKDSSVMVRLAYCCDAGQDGHPNLSPASLPRGSTCGARPKT